eukprot:SAG11_NODE_13490_length_653_cov_1.018051_2_plen_89_part_00
MHLILWIELRHHSVLAFVRSQPPHTHPQAVARAHGRRYWVAGGGPANTLVGAELVGSEYLVEVEAEAVVQLGDRVDAGPLRAPSAARL